MIAGCAVSQLTDWNALTDSGQIFVPVRYRFVRDSCGDIEHDDRRLSADVVSVAQSSELLLTGSVPAVEYDVTDIRVEGKRIHLDSHRRDVLLLELTRSMTLHERGLADTTI